ncbi:Rieske 2Fe-2S domain-containing protein [Mycobacterium sp. 48b]|uniref:Rieske 2Fe-2S domain-containing protein n=1 Tax=Mycobacterium sp. 48b TaxID=3400426 RepID=UPI003AAFE77C
MSDHVRAAGTCSLDERFARGWHCLGLAGDFTDGKPHAVEAFGTKLVVFTDSRGAVHVLDGVCRHMGGDLGRGSVKGDSIACPFHDWRWDGDGVCRKVPYAKRVPRLARTRSWTSCLENNLLFVWHDHENNPPPDDVVIPRIDEAFDEGWTDWSVRQWRISGSHSREVIDNMADVAHFFYVHAGLPISYRNVFEGHIARQFITNRGRPDVPELGPEFGKAVLTSESTYYGPAYAVTSLHTDYGGYEAEAVLLAFHYPIDHDAFMLHSAVSVRRPRGLDPETTEKIAGLIADGVAAGFEQDVEIFQHKAKIDDPLLADEDGPIYQLRRWYDQFYVDAGAVAPDMTDRFEFDLDTSYVVGVWTDEVEANVARQEAERADLVSERAAAGSITR